MSKNTLLSFLVCLGGFSLISANPRIEFLLEKNWKFTRDDSHLYSTVDFKDNAWQTVTVPHDWAIYGPFSPFNDRQKVAITQDGQQEALEHAGRTGGLPFVGTGWYRTRFSLPAYEKGKKVFLLFDGAMSNPQVYINGKKVGEWAYGYNSFYLDVTDAVLEHEENLLAVRLENYPESSRWYPGAGLYRNVHVIITNDVYIPVWGTYLTTPVIEKEYAKVNLRTQIEGNFSNPEDYHLITVIKNNSTGEVVAEQKTDLTLYDRNTFEQNIIVPSPSLWSPESPELYIATSTLYEGEILKDEYNTRFGIRSLEIRPDDGFYLNGEKTLFKGVCLHHDLGPLGAAVSAAAIRRQIRMLKDMGCNAIRTSHNMPSPELVNLCDEMGMMVMAESFDEWKHLKCRNGYNLLFDEWAEKDMVNLIHHFRNNPSLVFWCIGNEVPEQSIESGNHILRFLQDICYREDPTRPVTLGMDHARAVIDNNYGASVQIPGFNYRPFIYQEAYRKLPQQIILGTETASTVSSRGVYKFPVERGSMKKYEDHQSSSYDLEHCDWSNLPEDDFVQHEDLSYCIGEFVWTGFDYLGEPTPYYTDWPSHSSLFGIIDLAGIPKDRYYLYRSHWNKKEETLHILPHWNWKGREGEIVPVFVYTNYPAAELFINGKSQGKRTKDMSVTVNNSGDETSLAELKRQRRYRLMWMDTCYEPGIVEVIAYDEKGEAVAKKRIETAEAPYRLELITDRTSLTADGKDMAFVTVKLVDQYGNLCTDADRKVKFRVNGAGTYRAAANGDPTCLEIFHKPEMTLFNGMLTVIVQTTSTAGKITVEAIAKGVHSGKMEIFSENKF